MEHTPRRIRVGDDATCADQAVATFTDAIRQAQLRYLAAVGDAQVHLGGASPMVAAAAAVHARFTRQLFDAQRTLLQRRGQVELALRRSGTAEGADAASTMDTAGEAALSRLATLLDAWWRAEVAAGTALLPSTRTVPSEPSMSDAACGIANDAGGRGVATAACATTDQAVRTSAAAGASTSAALAASAVAPVALPALAEQLLATVRAAPSVALTTVLSELAASLAPAATAPGAPAMSANVGASGAPPATGGALITLEPFGPTSTRTVTTETTQTTETTAGDADPWMQFWNQGALRTSHRRPRRWLQLGSVASSAALIVALPFVAAWAR